MKTRLCNVKHEYSSESSSKNIKCDPNEKKTFGKLKNKSKRDKNIWHT